MCRAPGCHSEMPQPLGIALAVEPLHTRRSHAVALEREHQTLHSLPRVQTVLRGLESGSFCIRELQRSHGGSVKAL